MKILSNQKCLFEDIRLADTFTLRFLGLMPKKSLAPTEGLLLENCSRIHTNFMKFTIDVVYLSGQYEILDCETVKPWRLGKSVPEARHVLELAEGCGAVLEKGSRIVFAD